MNTVITKINLHLLKNETHVEFNESINKVFVKFNPQTMGFAPLYNLYMTALNNELDSLDFIRKSELTKIIHDQDHSRDTIFSGLKEAIKSDAKHFDPNYRAAANSLLNVFNSYGNISKKTLDDETAAIKDLLRELQQPALTAAVTTLGLANWVAKLSEENERFEQLMMNRYEETAEKTPYRMRDTRIETDKYYHAIVNQIDNQALLGISTFDALIKEMNTIIERFKHILAQQRGEKKHEDETKI
jgi:hypothetical protein